MLGPKSIAVLPFRNLGRSEEHEYFSDGITEDIINALAQIEKLRVISRGSSFYFKDKQLPIREIAQQLSVAYILEGSVRIAQGMVRISAQLISAQEDYTLWSQVWDRPFDSLFQVQDEVSLLIADKLREHIGHLEIAEQLIAPPTHNIQAYEYALQARYSFNKWNPAAIKEAVALYEKALTLDPGYAELYVGLADAYGFLATIEAVPRAEGWSKVLELTNKALSLDPDNAGAYYQLSNLAFFTQCNYQEAVKQNRKALALKPGYGDARRFMSFLYCTSGELDKAEKELELALALDPLNQETLFFKGYFLYRSGKYDEALTQLDTCLKANPLNQPAIVNKGYCLLKLADFKGVEEWAEVNKELIPEADVLGVRCLAKALSGSQSEGLLEDLRLLAQKPDAFQAHSYLFEVLACSGKDEEAFDWLDQCLVQKSTIVLLGFTDPLAEPIRQNPRFIDYQRKLYPQADEAAKPTAATKAHFDAVQVKIQEEKLQKLVEAELPYLNPALSLRGLAEQMEINPNQLSWLLNDRIGKSFSDFVNGHRVAHFKKLASDPKNSHISLLGLAYESGFNSKTSFNTFFKKDQGLTPREFLKQLAQ